MVLVLFLLFLLLLISTIFILLILSDLKIMIENTKFSSRRKEKNMCNGNFEFDYRYNFKIRLYLFGKMPYFQININKGKIEKFNAKKISKIISKLKNMKKIEIDKNDKEKLRRLLPKVEKLNLKIKIGTEDTIITSFLSSIISIIISLILPYFVKYKDIKNIKYKLIPLYNERNEVSINFDSIICIKMVHIISIIYIVLKKRRVDKNGRTSNRRAYAYSNE